MSLLPETRLSDIIGFSHKNTQPGKERRLPFNKEIPDCPHYQLITICGELAGITEAELWERDEFCGEATEDRDTIGPLSGFRGTVFIPRASCEEIYNRLKARLEIMEQNPPAPLTDEELSAEREKCHSLEEEKKLLETQIMTIEGKEKWEMTLSDWQIIIFENCCVPVLEEENAKSQPHFREIESPADLSYEEVIKKTRQLLESLRDQVTGEKEPLSVLNVKAAEHCPQTPKRQEHGMYSLIPEEKQFEE